jgi:hypothetical protein
MVGRGLNVRMALGREASTPVVDEQAMLLQPRTDQGKAEAGGHAVQEAFMIDTATDGTIAQGESRRAPERT